MKELLKALEEMLKQADINSTQPYLSDYERGCFDGRVDILEEVILLVNRIDFESK